MQQYIRNIVGESLVESSQGFILHILQVDFELELFLQRLDEVLQLQNIGVVTLDLELVVEHLLLALFQQRQILLVFLLHLLDVFLEIARGDLKVVLIPELLLQVLLLSLGLIQLHFHLGILLHQVLHELVYALRVMNLLLEQGNRVVLDFEFLL